MPVCLDWFIALGGKTAGENSFVWKSMWQCGPGATSHKPISDDAHAHARAHLIERPEVHHRLNIWHYSSSERLTKHNT